MPTAVVIAQEGDIHVYIKDELRGMNHEYRCSRVVLRSTSKYFSVLLDPEKFSEGIAIEARLQELSRKYVSLAAKPRSELPVVIISDVGQFPKDCAEIITAVRVFLDILHHHDGAHWPAISRAHSINLVALLAILADRFSSLEKVAGYLKRRGLETALLKDGKSTTPHKTELENRQRMLAGMLFGLPEWVRQCSAALIVEGPTRRTTTNLDSSEDEDPEGDEALWWRLPGGIEGT